MADQSELKSYFKSIAAEPAEMARYRGHLSQLLAEKTASRPFFRWSWAWLPLTVALAALVYLTPWRQTMPRGDIEQIRSWVAAYPNPGKLKQSAGSVARRGAGLDKLNALMVLCLVKPAGEAIQEAELGALEDPRPSFRSFYLEYLLDYGDEYQINSALIESRLDKEPDRLCRALYYQLLRLAPVS